MSRSDLLQYLCYPSYNRECVERRVLELEGAGVAEVAGLVGRGHSSVVLEVVLASGERAALKVLRTDSKRADLLTECEIARRAYPISPRVLKCGRHYILMELVRGVPVAEALREPERRLPLVLKTLSAGRGLDVLKVDHRELGRAHKHVILAHGGKIKIVDYESATTSEYPRNLCRLTSWIYNTLPNLKPQSEVLELLREYKKAGEDLRREVFREIVRHIAPVLEKSA
ncbi:MAG: hypothetical protein RMH84_03600 [Sulfolobales archaeon]|nr:hypothetical protein [Sulfolobales archaeon]MDW8010660.1 hypothetical protein [Sulfolobales archaeon]